MSRQEEKNEIRARAVAQERQGEEEEEERKNRQAIRNEAHETKEDGSDEKSLIKRSKNAVYKMMNVVREIENCNWPRIHNINM